MTTSPVVSDRHARLAVASLAATRTALVRVKTALDVHGSLMGAFACLDEAADHAITARLHVAAALPQHVAALEAESRDVEKTFFAVRNRLVTEAMRAVDQASLLLYAAKRNALAHREAQRGFDLACARLDKIEAYVPFMSRD